MFFSRNISINFLLNIYNDIIYCKYIKNNIIQNEVKFEKNTLIYNKIIYFKEKS